MSEFKTLVDMIEQSCARYAERPLFGTKRDGAWTFMTYADFYEQVARMRSGLASVGIGAGDRVAIIADNRVEWAVVSGATYGRGAQLVPMYQSQMPREWAFILRDCGAKIVFAANRVVADTLLSLKPELPALERVLCLDGPEDDRSSYAHLLSLGKAPPVEPKADSVAGFLYTSGTTGMPKGVLLTHANIMSNINGVHQVFTFEPDDRSLSFLPWAHAFGQVGELYMLLSMGCSIAINDDLPNLVANMLEVHPTVLFAVPRVFNKLYASVHHQMEEKPSFIRHLFDDGIELATEKAHGQKLKTMQKAELAIANKVVFSRVREKFGGKLKYAISASAALSPQVAEFVEALGITVFEGYGLSETSPVVTVNRPGKSKIGSVGTPIPGVRVVVDTTVADSTKEGEIIVYGPNVMRGYHERPEETAKAITPDGGLRTGDLGYVDNDGFLYITGRIKEQYKLENGKYVMPAPLEEQIKLSPLVLNAMMYGVNRPYNVAVIVPDLAAVQHRADELGLKIEGDALTSPVTRDLIQKELDERCKDFRGFEKPQRFVLVKDDFSTQAGLLTPTLKLKRHAAVAMFQKQIESLYVE